MRAILLGGGEQGRWVESLRGQGLEPARFRFGLGKKYGLGRFGKWALCPEAQKDHRCALPEEGRRNASLSRGVIGRASK